MVTAIIPAFNEGATVGEVVAAAKSDPAISEVIVVDDGSSDMTAAAAEKAGATVIRLSENKGKATAMDAGVRAAKGGIILFLDADVLGLTRESLSTILGPVLSGKREMYVGIRARRTVLLNRILHFFPILGGERALTKALWDSVPKSHKRGFEIEIALNHAAKKTEKGMGFELVYGLTHHIKERKYGFLVGFLGRIRMSYQVARVSFALYVFSPLASLFGALFRAPERESDL